MALMNDELGERTENPTALRLEEARRRGQVARSADLVSVVVVLAAMGSVLAFGPGLAKTMLAMMSQFLAPASIAGGSAEPLTAGLAPAIGEIIESLAPMIAVPLVVAILANMVQFRPLISAEVVKPNAGRIAPAAGLRRIWSGRSVVRLALSLAKIATVVAVFVLTTKVQTNRILSAGLSGPSDMIAELANLAGGLGVRLALALLALAGVDWLYQRWQYNRDMKITRRELLEDLRRSEGDPRITGRRKQMIGRLHDKSAGAPVGRGNKAARLQAGEGRN